MARSGRAAAVSTVSRSVQCQLVVSVPEPRHEITTRTARGLAAAHARHARRFHAAWRRGWLRFHFAHQQLVFIRVVAKARATVATLFSAGLERFEALFAADMPRTVSLRPALTARWTLPRNRSRLLLTEARRAFSRVVASHSRSLRDLRSRMAAATVELAALSPTPPAPSPTQPPAVPTPGKLLDAALWALRRRTGPSAFRLVDSAHALRHLRRGVAPSWVYEAGPPVLIIPFDGPTACGHFYGLWWTPENRQLEVADVDPAADRQPTEDWATLLGAVRFKYTRYPSAGAMRCADDTLRHAAARYGLRLPASRPPIAAAPVCPGDFELSAGTTSDAPPCKCRMCSYFPCECDAVIDDYARRHPVQTTASPRPASPEPGPTPTTDSNPRLWWETIQPSTNLDWLGGCDGPALSPAERAPWWHISPLLGLTADIARDAALGKSLADMTRALHSLPDYANEAADEDIENDFAGGAFGDDPEDARQFADRPVLSSEQIGETMKHAAIGDHVEVVWRFSASDAPDDVRLRVWYGTVRKQVGRLRPRWLVDYFANPYGPLLADDGTTITVERGTLPVSPTDANEIHVLALRLVQRPPDPIPRPVPDNARRANAAADGQSTSSDDDGVVAARGDEADAGVQVSGYAYINDAPAPLDVTLWPQAPDLPLDSWPRTFDTITGDTFLSDIALLSFEDAKNRCPDIVWAAVTQTVRKGHHDGIADFRSFLQELDPAARKIPLDALLCYYLQKRRVANKSKRNWRWSTVSRHAANVVAFIASLPLYCASATGVPVFSADATRWPLFRALLASSKREAVFQGAREPVAAVAADVAEALQHLRTKGDLQTAALLALCWFTAGRPGDVLQLLRDDVRFDKGDHLTARFRRSKVVKHVGEYVIHTRVTSDYARKVITDWKARGSGSGFLFPIANAQVRNKVITKLREALRHVRPELECRSLRRGTLQRLAKADATEEELLTFSRHTNAQQLRRYLGHGFVPHAAQRSAQGRAAALADGFPDITGGDADAVFADTAAVGLVRLADWCHVTLDGHAVFSLNRSPDLDLEKRDRSAYKLHAKPEAAHGIDLDAIDRMAAHPDVSNDVRGGWNEDKVWLSDVTGLYAAVEWDGKVRESTLSAKEVGQLLAINNVAAVTPEERHKVKGTIFVFKTPEDAKARFRVIKHPAPFNVHYGTETTRNRGNATRRSAREAIIDAEGAIDFDLAAFFDQIPLHDSATWYQVFEVRKAGLFRNLRKPMGGRHSTQTATSITRVLLAFPMADGVRSDYATDNVRFTGPRAGVIEAATTFARRCREAKAVLNDIDVTLNDNDLLSAVTQRFTTSGHDFLGEVADYGPTPYIRCRPKHVDKLQQLYHRVRFDNAKCAELFGLYAMLLYMSETLGIRLDQHLQTRLYFIDLARTLARDISLWDARARTVACPTSFPAKDLETWFHQAHANRPTPLRRAPQLDTVVFGDACGQGYAGVVCSRSADGSWNVRLLQHRWDAAAAANFALAESVVSEPLGAVRLLDEAKNVAGGRWLHAVYVTDHEPFSHAHRKGYSSSPFYNARVADLKDRHPSAELLWRAGETMVADKYSRLEYTELLEQDRANAIDEAAAILAARNKGRPCIVGTGEGAAAAIAAAPFLVGGRSR